MTDIFDTTILCKQCNSPMQRTLVHRNGFELRAVACKTCGDTIIHPADLNGMENFKNLRGKTFQVKLRMVGNSHAISIPKEIVTFMHEQHRLMSKQMDDMVRLCFEDFGKLSLHFGDEEVEPLEEEEYEEADEPKQDRFMFKKARRGERL